VTDQAVRSLIAEMRRSAWRLQNGRVRPDVAGRQLERIAAELEAELIVSDEALLAFFCPVAHVAAQTELPPPVGVQYPLEVSA
jgi:hypothetical protein